MKRVLSFALVMILCISLAAAVFADDTAAASGNTLLPKNVIAGLTEEQKGGLSEDALLQLAQSVIDDLTEEDVAGLTEEEVTILVMKRIVTLTTGVLSPEVNPVKPVDPNDPYALDGSGLGAVSPQTGVSDPTGVVVCVAVAAALVFFGSTVYLKKAH